MSPYFASREDRVAPLICRIIRVVRFEESAVNLRGVGDRSLGPLLPPPDLWASFLPFL